ncbi:MAG TPA: hypothetical protein VIM09_04845 [Chthoniobacterales bacterium]
MKLAILFLSICCALLLGGCADRSLMTDEEYDNSRKPAPNSPDPTMFLPNTQGTTRY